MQKIETPTLTIHVLDDTTVVLEGRPGVNIDARHARRDNELIAGLMPGDYGIIIDRKADYSIAPVEVYEVLNAMTRLKAIAIVAHRPITAATAPAEKPLYRGLFRTFLSVDDAHAWLKSVLPV